MAIVGTHYGTKPGSFEISNHSLSIERSGARKQSKQCEANERVSIASKRANSRASGPSLTSQFMAVLNCSGAGDIAKRAVVRAIGMTVKW